MIWRSARQCGSYQKVSINKWHVNGNILFVVGDDRVDIGGDSRRPDGNRYVTGDRRLVMTRGKCGDVSVSPRLLMETLDGIDTSASAQHLITQRLAVWHRAAISASAFMSIVGCRSILASAA